jgi:ABC-type sulfate transport system permease component
VAALVADIWTIFITVLIVGWQISIFLRSGSWPALPLSSVFNKLESDRGAIYATASADEIERDRLADVVDAMLRVPTIVPLLVAGVLLTAFYLWLMHTEKRYSGN